MFDLMYTIISKINNFYLNIIGDLFSLSYNVMDLIFKFEKVFRNNYFMVSRNIYIAYKKLGQYNNYGHSEYRTI